MRRPAIERRTHDLGDLFDREVDRLWRSVFAFTQDRAITDDAVAEAFAQCLAAATRSATRERGSGAQRSASRPAS